MSSGSLPKGFHPYLCHDLTQDPTERDDHAQDSCPCLTERGGESRGGWAPGDAAELGQAGGRRAQVTLAVQGLCQRWALVPGHSLYTFRVCLLRARDRTVLFFRFPAPNRVLGLWSMLSKYLLTINDWALGEWSAHLQPTVETRAGDICTALLTAGNWLGWDCAP